MQEPNQFTQSDREAIIRLTLIVERMGEDIKNLTQVVDGRLGDHETRIRFVERICDDFVLVRKIVYSMVSVILLSVVGAVIALILR